MFGRSEENKILRGCGDTEGVREVAGGGFIHVDQTRVIGVMSHTCTSHTYVHNMSVTQMLQKRHRKLDRMECFCIQKIMNFPVFYANEVLVTLSWAVRP